MAKVRWLKDGELITPKAGEFWQERNFYGGGRGGEADPKTGLVYQDPMTGQLMFADFHFKPCLITKDMIHGINNWSRIHPPVP